MILPWSVRRVFPFISMWLPTMSTCFENSRIRESLRSSLFYVRSLPDWRTSCICEVPAVVPSLCSIRLRCRRPSVGLRRRSSAYDSGLTPDSCSIALLRIEHSALKSTTLRGQPCSIPLVVLNGFPTPDANWNLLVRLS